MTDPVQDPAPRPSRGPLLLLALLLALALGVGVVSWPEAGHEVTEAEAREQLEALRARPQGPIPGTLNDYLVEWNPGHLRVTDARGDWMWIALEDARATDIVFGLDLPQGQVQAAEEGLLLIDGTTNVTSATVIARDPTRVRVLTPTGLEERPLTGSVHDDVAARVFAGAERRPLREVLEAVTRPR